MGTARTYSCSNCGAPVDEGARRCEYCSAPIATVRCGRCYHMNVPENPHCAGCGHPLGLEPIGAASDRACPACQVVLQAFATGSGALSDCAQCGGQFVEHALLRELLERRAIIGDTVPRRIAPKNPLSQPVRYLPCPVCGTLMNRKNFGRVSGIIVDVCTPHGMWFDAGELPQVLSFVESGGLAKARHRMLEDEQNERRRTFATPSIGAPSSTENVHILSGIADAGLGLLAFVADLLDR